MYTMNIKIDVIYIDLNISTEFKYDKKWTYEFHRDQLNIPYAVRLSILSYNGNS